MYWNKKKRVPHLFNEGETPDLIGFINMFEQLFLIQEIDIDCQIYPLPSTVVDGRISL